MSFFDKKRLGNETFKLDIDRMRKGFCSKRFGQMQERGQYAVILLPASPRIKIGMDRLDPDTHLVSQSFRLPESDIRSVESGDCMLFKRHVTGRSSFTLTKHQDFAFRAQKVLF